MHLGRVPACDRCQPPAELFERPLRRMELRSASVTLSELLELEYQPLDPPNQHEAIIVLPVLAGLLAGTFSAGKLPAHVLASVCVALGVAGGIAMALDDDTTGRIEAVAFAVVTGAVGALLVYGGWYAGRAGIRAIRST